jgi:hypothetical protein
MTAIMVLKAAIGSSRDFSDRANIAHCFTGGDSAVSFWLCPLARIF